MLPLPAISNHSGTGRRTHGVRAHGSPRHTRVHFSPARLVITTLLVLGLAPFFEIAGCFAFWLGFAAAPQPLSPSSGSPAWSRSLWY